MGQRSLFGSSAVIVAALTLAACSSPLPTGVGEVPAPSAVRPAAGSSASDAPGEAGSWTGRDPSGRGAGPVPADALLDSGGTGWLGGGG